MGIALCLDSMYPHVSDPEVRRAIANFNIAALYMDADESLFMEIFYVGASPMLPRPAGGESCSIV
jgi:heptaprenylglyceryl phosphate synthase